MNITRKNILTGKNTTRNIPVDPNDYMLYQLDMGSIDTLMPYLSEDDRQFIMFGITEKEWKEHLKKASEKYSAIV